MIPRIFSELGLQDVNVTKHAVVTAYLPSNHPELTQTIGFISHLDVKESTHYDDDRVRE